MKTATFLCKCVEIEDGLLNQSLINENEYWFLYRFIVSNRNNLQDIKNIFIKKYIEYIYDKISNNDM